MKTPHILTESERQDLVSYRLQRAKGTLPEADSLIRDGYYNAAINRLYYACYYAVIALLIQNKIEAQTHQGVKQMFALHYIANKKMEQRYSIFYSRLFNSRMSGDYDDFIQYDSQMLSDIRPQAEEFIKAIEAEITTQLS
ncbi:DNA-binding protein [Bacteroidia bacterium]|nr:DNA-binding protein [Bacteroidia bacterium]